MTQTIIERLADFTEATAIDALPSGVIEECKLIILDSIGCALAAVGQPKGRAGIDYGRLTGGGAGTATIIGTSDKVSVFGAAFANGELINTLDMDAVLPPGHVCPYVLPGALAMAEQEGASGAALIEATALAHEMSYRLGKAMDYLRDTRDGKVHPPEIYGYSSTVFGATAAILKVKGAKAGTIAHALGIAGCIAPVQSQAAWFQHAPSSTIKYLQAGVLTQAAFNAAYMAELGHRGDVMVLDDRQYGFPRFIGTKRWEPAPITDALGDAWRFTAEQAYKPYPHCRILHALIDAMTGILDAHDIKPAEIERINAYVEGFVEQPVWLNRRIEHVHDAQFSIAHGLALAAHRVKPGKAWMDEELVFGPSVMGLMDRVTHQVHPDYVKLLQGNAASRPAIIEITARGQTFRGERRYPRGSKAPEEGVALTVDELIAKFRHNAEGVIAPAQVDRCIEAAMGLDRLGNVRTLMEAARAAPAVAVRAA
ncbi:MAG: MmgE/PrpD family protein [Sphingomonas bacterium]